MENTSSSKWFVIFVLMNIISMFFFPRTGYANTNWLKYFRKDSMLNTYKRAYAVIDDSLWVGTFGDGLMVIEGDKTKSFTNNNTRSTQRVDDGLLTDYITCLAIDERSSTIWVGTNAGLASCDLNGENWQRFTGKPSLPNNVIRDIAIGRDGTLWVGTPSGLAAYDGEKWTTYDESNGLFQASVRSLNVQGDSLWVGTVGGTVSQYKNGKWKTFMSY